MSHAHAGAPLALTVKRAAIPNIEIGMDDVSKLGWMAPRQKSTHLLAPPEGGISWEIFPPMPIPGLDMAIDTWRNSLPAPRNGVYTPVILIEKMMINHEFGGHYMLLCLNEPTCKILSHHWQGFAMHLASDMDLRCFLTRLSLSPSRPQTHSCAAPEMCVPNSHKKWGFHASDEASRGRPTFILQFGNFVGPKWRTSDLTHPCRFRLVLRVLGQVEHLLDDEDNFGGVLGEQMNPFPPDTWSPKMNESSTKPGLLPGYVILPFDGWNYMMATATWQ